MFSDPAARRFVIGVLVAFLPAAMIGAALHSVIKAYLFNPWVVCFTLIAGGAVLLWVDQLELEPKYHDVMQFSLPMCLIIGFCQCLAMIPGVSRSGATIVSAMLLGADKRVGGGILVLPGDADHDRRLPLDLYKNRDQHDDRPRSDLVGDRLCGARSWPAIIVVKTFLTYVIRHGFTLFAWWRVIVGSYRADALALGR